MGFQYSKSYYTRFGAILAKRDGGYKCAYCGRKLVPPGTSHKNVTYYDRRPVPTLVTLADGRTKVGTRYEYDMKAGYARGSVDHVHPRSKGGTDELSNLVLCCEGCNSAKGARPPYKWRTQPYSGYRAKKRK